MKKKLGVLEEVAYSYRLMQRLNQSENSSFVVYSFSEIENIEKFLENDFLDVLLIGECYYEDILNTYNISHKFILYEEKSDCINGNGIYKYQAASSILGQLNGMLNMYFCNDIESDSPIRIFGVYSPVGRCGKTSFSLALAKKMSAEKQVLYLNLRPFSSVKTNLSDEKLSLSDVFYFLEEGKSEKVMLEKAVTEFEGVKFIIPMESPVDLHGIKEECWNDFFMKLNEGKFADVIIVDFDESISCFIQLFELCEKVYMPMLEDNKSLEKVRRFENFLCRSVSKEVEKKVCKLQLPVLGKEELPALEQFINRIIEKLDADG